MASVLRSMPSDADRPGRVRRSSSHYTQGRSKQLNVMPGYGPSGTRCPVLRWASVYHPGVSPSPSLHTPQPGLL